MKPFNIPSLNDRIQFYNEFAETRRSEVLEVWSQSVHKKVKDLHALKESRLFSQSETKKH